MYKSITTSVQMDGERLEEFEVTVRVNQDSVLSPILFAIIMDEITKDTRECGVKKHLNADDLVLHRDSCRKKHNLTKKIQFVTQYHRIA